MRWILLGATVTAATAAVVWRSWPHAPPGPTDAPAVAVSTAPTGEVRVVTRSPALLVSECRSPDEVLGGELRLAEVPALRGAERVCFDRLSCGCTSVLLDGVPVGVGPDYPLPAGGGVVAAQSALRQGVAGERSSTVWFRVKLPGADPTPVVWEHGQRLLADAEARPDVLAETFRAATSPALSRAVRVAAHTRSAAPPAVTAAGVDDGLEVAGVGAPAPAVEAEPGVWRHEWDVRLGVRPLPKDGLDANVRRASLAVAGVGRVAVAVAVRRVFGVEAPAALHFGAAAVKRVVLRSSDGRPFRVLPSPPAGPFSVSKFADQPKVLQVVELTYAPESDGEHGGVLTVRTDHPDSPELAVAVQGVGRAAAGGAP